MGRGAVARRHVWLNPCQYYAGSVFFVARECVSELHELAADERHAHLAEWSMSHTPVHREFEVREMNDEALGNPVPRSATNAPVPHDA